MGNDQSTQANFKNDRKRSKRLSPEKRKEQLLQCAITAFADHGISRATHAHVADRAGTSVSTVHAYFRRREDLQLAVLNAVEAHLLELVESCLAGRDSVEVTLDRLATRFAAEASANPDLIRVWLDWSTGVRQDVWPRYLELLDQFHFYAKAVFARGKREGTLPRELNTMAAARLYIGGGHTLALMQFSKVSKSAMKTFTMQFVRSAMNVQIK
ncbi:TetR/AcrR family transcriptional regulator [uncultured Erythrobacter sp.]|uniref:TetR/AcrR family transcriptional regulator n=1 Tax=Parasphingorhabdus sp. TaxID=2709688 RepID=UPI00263580BA|nr:TetR/AcrR family transcriptional regulator [uncultured Erythrobacter sp.]